MPQISQSASGRHKFIPGLFFRTQNSQLYLGSENKEPFYVNAIYIEIGFIPQNVPYLESVCEEQMSLNKLVQPLYPEIYPGLSLKMGWFVL